MHVHTVCCLRAYARPRLDYAIDTEYILQVRKNTTYEYKGRKWIDFCHQCFVRCEIFEKVTVNMRFI